MTFRSGLPQPLSITIWLDKDWGNPMQIETSLLKQYVAGGRVDLLDEGPDYFQESISWLTLLNVTVTMVHRELLVPTLSEPNSFCPLIPANGPLSSRNTRKSTASPPWPHWLPSTRQIWKVVCMEMEGKDNNTKLNFSSLHVQNVCTKWTTLTQTLGKNDVCCCQF